MRASAAVAAAIPIVAAVITAAAHTALMEVLPMPFEKRRFGPSASPLSTRDDDRPQMRRQAGPLCGGITADRSGRLRQPAPALSLPSKSKQGGEPWISKA